MSGALQKDFLLVLRRHLGFLDEQDEVPMEVELVSLGLDSVNAINLLLELEMTFGVSFPGSLLTPGTFRTADSLKQAVESLVAP